MRLPDSRAGGLSDPGSPHVWGLYGERSHRGFGLGRSTSHARGGSLSQSLLPGLSPPPHQEVRWTFFRPNQLQGIRSAFGGTHVRAMRCYGGFAPDGARAVLLVPLWISPWRTGSSNRKADRSSPTCRSSPCTRCGVAVWPDPSGPCALQGAAMLKKVSQTEPWRGSWSLIRGRPQFAARCIPVMWFPRPTRSRLDSPG